MHLIVGLGNPGREYAGTKHNVGFEVINKLAYDHNIDINRAKHRAHFGEGRIGDKKVLLAKPQTFMNLSGECVRELLRYYNIPPEALIVIYDDISLAPGEIRIRDKGSAGGHNGIKNIIYQLETDVFLRIKVGIGAKPQHMDLADYVLSRFRPNEMDNIVLGVTKAGEATELLLDQAPSQVMNQFNRKTGVKESE